ncbi:hypothetical protein VC03_06125 [Sneathia vaginalis]|jgi:hypothetical protein|uniref:CidA/LrgA family protein n=3 Tax=Sneathia TaxID=168808 RepID=A0A0E3UV82_9FUSO|nr:CidA/LrgA family protein [Sneathia vaginalis]AKC96043.1 hypothetical protein VC03_06125 [Sneathia vaginalis]
MNVYKEIMYILIFSLIGELFSKGLKLPIPGSVIGMLILFAFLEFNILKMKKIEKVGEFLLENLGILFVPAGVGIMVKFNFIKEIWLSFFVIAIFTTIFSLIITVKIVEIVKQKFEGDEDA